MVAYGPWVQEPDYSFVVEWDADDNGDPLIDFGHPPNVSGQGYQEFATWDSWEEARDSLPATIGEAVGKINDGEYNSGIGAPKGTLATYNIGNDGTVLEGPFTFSKPTVYSPQWLIIPAYPSNSDEGWRPFNYWPGLYAGGDQVWPEGVIGIDWQDKPGPYDPPYETVTPEWVTVEIEPTTELVGTNHDNSLSTTEPNAALSGGFSTELAVRVNGSGEMPSMQPTVAYADSDLAALAVSRVARTLGGDPVDVSDHLRANGDGLVIFTRTPTYVAPRYVNDGSFTAPPRWEYGWVLDRLDLRWTLRPPVYRWVYDTKPYRRTFPRDDGLAGGAGRTYPPSRAVQTSNRTTGYL